MGVDVIDIGAQSTRPGADEIGSALEIERLIPTLREVRKRFPNIIISVDTFNSDVAFQALLNGANWINDVTGGRRDEEIYSVVSKFDCPFVITHSKGNSQTMSNLTSYQNLIEDIIDSLKILIEKAASKGVNMNKLILTMIFILRKEMQLLCHKTCFIFRKILLITSTILTC